MDTLCGITVPSLPGSASWITRISSQKSFNMIAKTKHTALFTVWCIALLFVLPIATAVLESRIDHVVLSLSTYWKWYIFWGVGIRLFFRGVILTSAPQQMELGFANMALGSMGILSVIN